MFERTVLRPTPGELLAARPGGAGNSLSWLMWHLARVEDVVVNAVVRGRPQVLLAEGWGPRLGVDDARVGTGFTDDEVARFSREADPVEVDAYWQAVRAGTAGWLKEVPLTDLDVVPDFDARLAVAPPIVPDEAKWLLDLWRGRSTGWFVRFPVIDHGFLHLGQMQEIRGRLGVHGV
jgi:hypothetical protein